MACGSSAVCQLSTSSALVPSSYSKCVTHSPAKSATATGRSLVPSGVNKVLHALLCILTKVFPSLAHLSLIDKMKSWGNQVVWSYISRALVAQSATHRFKHLSVEVQNLRSKMERHRHTSATNTYNHQAQTVQVSYRRSKVVVRPVSGQRGRQLLLNKKGLCVLPHC